MKTKKWRDVKNALVMVVVMAAMMSTATYAWFTLTSNATVTGMQMTAGGTSGLKVSVDGGSNWLDAVDLAANLPEGTDPTQTIQQVTVEASSKDAENNNAFGTNFFRPVYNNTGDEVTGIEQIPPAKVGEYVATYSFKLKADAEGTKVALVSAAPGIADLGITNGQLNNEGSFVRAKDAGTVQTAARAVRMGIVVDNKMYIYEPNNEASENNNAGADDADGFTSTTYVSTVVAADVTGTITTGGAGDTSNELFTVGPSGKDVTVYVWLEGTDKDCKNNIQANKLEAQIQFTALTE